jgi:drug/metabolite transporter (DMT)-like permease
VPLVSAGVLAVVLLGAFLHASWNALVHGSREKLLDTVLILCGAALISLALLPALGLPDPASLPWLFVSLAIHMAYFTLVIQSYRGGELSIVYPLMRGSAPALSALGTVFFLHESPPAWGWAGVGLVSGGVILLAALAWSREGSHRHALWLALANAVVIAAYTVVDARGVRLSGNAFAYTACLFVLTALLMVAAGLLIRGLPAMGGHMRQYWRRGLLGGFCTFASYGLALWAMTRAPVALVAALRETSVMFALLLAALFARERIGPGKLASVLLVAGGAALMKLA